MTAEEVGRRLDHLEAEIKHLRAELRQRPDTTMEHVARAFGVLPDALSGSARAPRLVRARWCAMLLYRNRGLSFPAIGRRLHHDQSSVQYGVRKIKQEMEENRELAEKITRLVRELEAK